MLINDMLDWMNRKRRSEERRKTAVKFAIGITLAGMIGLAEGILFAPKSGKETRKELKRHVVDALASVKTRLSERADSRALLAREQEEEEAEELAVEGGKKKKKDKAIAAME